jgi:pimeloyl-ACP methyl ester carboxylesterase
MEAWRAPADDLKHRREVALRILRPEVASSIAGSHFLREIEISAKLRHQRMTASPENAVRLRSAINVIDVENLLGKVSVPTLVMHCRDDATVPFEEGRRLAGRIRGARFVALEGNKHLIMEDDPDWPRFLDEIRSFLDD